MNAAKMEGAFSVLCPLSWVVAETDVCHSVLLLASTLFIDFTNYIVGN